MMKVAVFGVGSWGTAFSLVLADAGQDVTIWVRRFEVCAVINERHENIEYFLGIELPFSVRVTTDLEEAAAGVEFVVFLVPSQKLRENLSQWIDVMLERAVFVFLMKGVEFGTTKWMSEVIAEVMGAGLECIAVVSGFNLVCEIVQCEPAVSVVACEDELVVWWLQELCHSQAFWFYRSIDVLGCELGGVYKNVVVFCVGMAIGLGFGDNTIVLLITRGLVETVWLAMKFGVDLLTLMGFVGLGDFVATCFLLLSRNRTFGEKLGQGMSIEEIIVLMCQVVEGAKSCVSLYDLASNSGVDVPVVEHVVQVVAGEMSARDMMYVFIACDIKHECE